MASTTNIKGSEIFNPFEILKNREHALKTSVQLCNFVAEVGQRQNGRVCEGGHLCLWGYVPFSRCVESKVLMGLSTDRVMKVDRGEGCTISYSRRRDGEFTLNVGVFPTLRATSKVWGHMSQIWACLYTLSSCIPDNSCIVHILQRTWMVFVHVNMLKKIG